MPDDVSPRPDPFAELRPLALATLAGINYWSRRPVTRLDVAVGAYDDISSADAPGFTEALVAALPGLEEHECSVGGRGGFVTRLRRGTYAPHIVEHVALELQSMIGHHVGYGRTRGGDEPETYVVVFEHEHARVGRRAAELALDVVRRAFAGTLHDVSGAVDELRSLAAAPDDPPLRERIRCAVLGGAASEELARTIAARIGADASEVVALSPAMLVDEGLPYRRSDVAVVLRDARRALPERYRDDDRAVRLLSVVIDGVERGGVVVMPAAEGALREYAVERGRRVASFTGTAEAAVTAVLGALAEERPTSAPAAGSPR